MKVALTGGAYQAHSVIASAQRCLNLVQEPIPEGQGEPMPSAAYPTPGTTLLGTIGTGPIRGIRQCTTGGVYVVSGDTLYSVDVSNWSGTPLGTLTPGIKTPVSMQDNGLDMVVVDGMIAGWDVTLASNTMAPIPVADGIFAGADHVDYLDTFFILNKPGTPQFYISGSLAVTFDPLDFANKEAYSDLLVTVVVAKRLVYLFGERTTEIWYDAGATFSTTDPTVATSFQFAPMQSEVFIDHGCAAKYSPAVYDNSVFWLTRDRQGQGIIMMVAGYQTKRVSTYAIEAEIAGYARISDAIGFTYQLAGHTFYVLTFPHADKTWSYDIATGLWHQWAWIDTNGDEHRHRANCFWPVNDIPVIGDWQNGNLYALDQKVFTDNGSPIKRTRTFPHTLADGKRVFYRQFLADMETGWAPEIISGSDTRLLAQFTAADGTNLSAYTSEVGGGWTAVGGAANAQIIADEVVGTGGTALYQSATTILTPDYTLHFDVIPPAYDSVLAGNTLWAIGRASGANTGYRVAVSADGTQYTLTLAVLPAGASASVAMGTIASGRFTVWLVLRGSNITAQVQRSVDGWWLRTDGTWHTDPGTIAAQFADATYSVPGAIMVGGTWPPLPSGLTATLRPPMSPNADWPSGFADNVSQSTWAFDFTRNWWYDMVSGSGQGGISITDLNTMAVIRAPTNAQMYAGTPFGSPAGTPWAVTFGELTAGNGTDLFAIISPSLFSNYFTRIDPVTMKVTGEIVANTWAGAGVVNTTATHTIVAYLGSVSLSEGVIIYDGTGMVRVTTTPLPRYGAGNTMSLIAGKKNSDGSCDFVLSVSDSGGGSGNIDIWRINVSDSLAVTNTRTGTLSTLGVVPATAYLWVTADYDTAHDRIIMAVTNGFSPHVDPSWIISANYNGSINWTLGPPDSAGGFSDKGSSRLTGSTLMIGDSAALRMLDTATGAITFTGSILVSGVSAGSFFRVWNAPGRAYFTYALSRGFTRIAFPTSPMLALDNVIATATAGLLSTNLVSLRWSDDRGHSWGSPVTQDIGEAGEYRTSLQWQRLAYARDRVFEISWSVPMRTALQGCWVDVTPAQS